MPEQCEVVGKVISVLVDQQRFRHRLARRCNCPTKTYELIAIIAANGVKQFRLRCRECKTAGLYNIPHYLLTPAERADARCAENNVDHEQWPACARCGSLAGVEAHHTAPRAFFTDADDWPIVLLCRDCHKRWHATMQEKHA